MTTNDRASDSRPGDASGIARLSTGRKILFSILPLAILLVVAELGLRIAFFQARSEDPLALISAFKHVRNLRYQVDPHGFDDVTDAWEKAFPALYTPVGADLLREYMTLYEQDLVRLRDAVREVDARLLVLYVPSADEGWEAIRPTCRTFFRDVTARNGVDFLDLTERLDAEPAETWTLLPEDYHLSRYGHYLVARELGRYLDGHVGGFRSGHRFAERPALLGDLRPDNHRLLEHKIPYRIDTSRQGLRMSYELAFPKARQRVLLLGDSFTYGSYVHNHDTFAAILDRQDPDRELVNAGVIGYTLADELALFEERARYVEPDVVVLQVLDNDLHGMFFFYRGYFGRRGATVEPSPTERAFFTELGLGHILER